MTSIFFKVNTMSDAINEILPAQTWIVVFLVYGYCSGAYLYFLFTNAELKAQQTILICSREKQSKEPEFLVLMVSVICTYSLPQTVYHQNSNCLREEVKASLDNILWICVTIFFVCAVVVICLATMWFIPEKSAILY